MSVIDISFYQGHPDFGQVKSAGITTVIMKCADGEGGTIVDDSMYVANRASARAVGLAVGSYFFNGNALSPSASAAHQWAIIDWHPGDLVAIDVEGGSGIVWNVGQVAEWCRWMLARGVPAGQLLVYMSSSLEHSLDWSPVVALGVQLWVAQYGANDGTPGNLPTLAHWPSWALWQYTSTKTWPGISGHVDTSTFSPSFASLTETLITSTPAPLRKKTKMPNAVVDQEQGSGTFNWIAVVTDNGQLHEVDPSNRGWWDALAGLYTPALAAVPTNHAGYGQFVAANQTMIGGAFPTAQTIAAQIVATLPPVSSGTPPTVADIVTALTAIIPTAVQNAAATRAAIIK